MGEGVGGVGSWFIGLKVIKGVLIDRNNSLVGLEKRLAAKDGVQGALMVIFDFEDLSIVES